jgi:hypothetical protein
MKYLNYIATLIILIGVGMLYDRFKEKFDLDDETKQYDLIKKYLLNDSSLANSKKPLLWIHMNYKKNSRWWQSFYSRNTVCMNQPYQYLSVASIINHCGKSFNIVIIDDNTFSKIIPGWTHDMTRIPFPIKMYFRQLALSRILYHYGGMLVPSSFICTRDLLPMYEEGIRDKCMFVGEFINNSISNQSGAANFIPSTKLMGCVKECPAMLELINYIEIMISQDYTSEALIDGNINRKCYELTETNKANKIPAGMLGVKSKLGGPIILDDLMGCTFISFMPNLYGIYIPEYQILSRTKFEWFARLSEEQVLESNTIIGKLLLTNAFNATNNITNK